MSMATNTLYVAYCPTTAQNVWARAVVRSKDASHAPVLLEDIADISTGINCRDWVLPRSAVKLAVLMTVTKQPATSTLELTDKLETSLKELQSLPPDVKVSTDIFRQMVIESSIGNVQGVAVGGGNLRSHRPFPIPCQCTYHGHLTGHRCPCR